MYCGCSHHTVQAQQLHNIIFKRSLHYEKNIKLVRIIIAAVIFIAGLVLGINGYSKRMSDSYADAKAS